MRARSKVIFACWASFSILVYSTTAHLQMRKGRGRVRQACQYCISRTRIVIGYCSYDGYLTSFSLNLFISLWQVEALPKLASRGSRDVATLQRKSTLCIPRTVIARSQSQLPYSCVCELFIYSQDRSTYFPAAE